MFDEFKKELDKISSYQYKLSLTLYAIVCPIAFCAFLGLTIWAFTKIWFCGLIVLAVLLALTAIFTVCICYCYKRYKKALKREKEQAENQPDKT